jgi:hypothetical protein
MRLCLQLIYRTMEGKVERNFKQTPENAAHAIPPAC